MQCQLKRFIRLVVLVFLPVLVVACGGSDCDSVDMDCGEETTSAAEGQLDNDTAAEVSVEGDSAAGDATVDIPPATPGVFRAADITHLAVITGQSNVEASETAFDPTLDHPDPRVFAFTDDGWQVADLHQVWDINAHPGNHALTDPNNSPNNNMVFHYGKTMAQMDSDAVVGFVVLAAPGEGIANWDFESPFYLKMRDKINSALSQLPQKDKIDVMLWHQGESDAQYEGTSDTDATGFTDKTSPEYINYYSIKLKGVIDNFRSEPWGRVNLPFICGETRIGFEVNRRLLELNEDNDPNTHCVQATDLPFNPADPSGAHFSAEGLRELGRRYMQAFVDIVNL